VGRTDRPIAVGAGLDPARLAPAAPLVRRIVAAAVLCCAAGCSDSPVPLTTTLDGSREARTAEFDRRIGERFPVGSPEAVLLAELGRQGFSVEDRYVPAGFEHGALRQEHDIVCVNNFEIYWRTDEAARIAAVKGVAYWPTCL
jgi:hypothetical protein